MTDISIYRVSQNRCNLLIWQSFITETSAVAVIQNTLVKNTTIELGTSSQCLFVFFLLNFFLYQLLRCVTFFDFLVSLINHYDINGLPLFWEIFEWFYLQTSSDTKYIFPLLSKGLWERINSWYRILFSDLKYIEWAEIIGYSHGSHVYWDTLNIDRVSRNNMAVTLVPCILRHTLYTYTEWAEIIGQSHGSHLYWDKLYIQILSE